MNTNTATKRIEVSRDGRNWLPCYIREAPEAMDAQPDSVLPEGYSWGRVDGRWVHVLDVAALRS